jgi:hypothetical protein
VVRSGDDFININAVSTAPLAAYCIIASVAMIIIIITSAQHYSPTTVRINIHFATAVARINLIIYRKAN